MASTIVASQVPQHRPEEPNRLQHHSHSEEPQGREAIVVSSDSRSQQELYSDALLDAALSLPPVLLSAMTAVQIEHRLQRVRDIAEIAMRSQGK